VEDEFGGLKIIDGDLSYLLDGAPTLDAIFADQLKSKFCSMYETHQLAVWGNPPVADRGFKLGDTQVDMLQLLVLGEKYTVSVFV